MANVDIMETLRDRNLLIIEDEIGLCKRLEREFIRFGVKKIDAHHSMENGKKGLDTQGLIYDLIIVDIMLPRTEDDLNKIMKIQGEIQRCVDVLKQNDRNPKDPKIARLVLETREEYKLLQLEIQKHICKTGGVEMIQNWTDSLQHDNRPPILYFTAVGDCELMKAGMDAAEDKNVDWLTKPSNMQEIMKRSARLIAERT